MHVVGRDGVGLKMTEKGDEKGAFGKRNFGLSGCEWGMRPRSSLLHTMVKVPAVMSCCWGFIRTQKLPVGFRHPSHGVEKRLPTRHRCWGC